MDRCEAMTKAGLQCKRKKADGSCFCKQHISAVNEPVETPVETPVRTPVETSVRTPVETPVRTPVKAAVSATQSELSRISRATTQYMEEAIELFEALGLHEKDLTDRKVILLGSNARTRASMQLVICAAGGKPATKVTTSNDIVVIRHPKAKSTKTYSKAIELGCEIREEEVTSRA